MVLRHGVILNYIRGTLSCFPAQVLFLVYYQRSFFCRPGSEHVSIQYHHIFLKSTHAGIRSFATALVAEASRSIAQPEVLDCSRASPCLRLPGRALRVGSIPDRGQS